MKRLASILLLLLVLRGTAGAQGTVFPYHPELVFNADFSAASNSTPEVVWLASADYFHLFPPILLPGGPSLFTTNTLDVVIMLGTAPAEHMWILQQGNDGLMTPVFELTNQVYALETFPDITTPGGHIIGPGGPGLPPPVFGYICSQTLPLNTDQILHLFTGKWYVDVDFGTTNYVSRLTLASGRVFPPQPGIPSPFSPFSDWVNAIAIAPNNQNVQVVMDGSVSVDPYGLPLQFTWSEGDQLLGTSAVLTHVFSVGDHPVTLTVNDGLNSGTIFISLKVITAGDEVRRLMAMVEQSGLLDWQKQRLAAPLSRSALFFDRGNSIPAVQSLQLLLNPGYQRLLGVNTGDQAGFDHLIQALIDVVETAQTRH